MPFRDRGSFKVWPFPTIRINWARRGLRLPHFTSITVKLGPWQWNTRTRKHSVDHPGPGYWQSR